MRTPNVLALGALAGSLLAPVAASACGGFFCNATPVDQQAERIIFVQEDADTVTSYVEINYQGDPEAFAWVVPVPAVPELDVWFSGAFNALDLATQPIFNTPWACLFEADADGAAGGGNDDRGNVDVLARERVGPFDTATIQSDDPRALVEWLRVNEYRITPAMEPFIAMYTDEGMKFLAMKLAPGEDTASIRPIKMTYTAAGPAVPLRLTAVAAQLEMGVKVWILGEGRYGPLNVPDVEIPDADLKFDMRSWQTNYLPLVARKVDDQGGRGFVTELSEPTADYADAVRNSFIPDFAGEEAQEARDALVELLESRPYITRLYTRLSPEEMDIDPMFGLVAGGDVDRFHDVPPPEGADECAWELDGDGAAEACDFVACGAGGVCADVEPGVAPRGAGCGCVDGSLARAGFGPDGQLEVACADVRLNFTAPELDPGNLAFVDVCAQGDFCGADGECVMHNGFPSCRCDAGFVAVPTLDEMGMPVPTCVAPSEPLAADAFALIELEEPNLPYPGRETPMEPDPGPEMPDDNRGGGAAAPGGDVLGCTTTPGAPADLPLFWLALPLVGLALRRR